MTPSKVRFLIRIDAGGAADAVLRRLGMESPFGDDPPPLRIEAGGRRTVWGMTRDAGPSGRLIRLQRHLERVAELYRAECADPALALDAGFITGDRVLLACSGDRSGAVPVTGGQHVREIARWFADGADGRGEIRLSAEFSGEQADPERDARVAGFLTAAYISEQGR